MIQQLANKDSWCQKLREPYKTKQDCHHGIRGIVQHVCDL